MARENKALRKQAWIDGDEAGRAGWTLDACTYHRGTIYYDDWCDGHEHGRFVQELPRRFGDPR